jgi:tetratricopeptide (TPR) repeat protein
MLHLEIARLGRTQGDLDTALEHIAVAEEKARYPNEVYNVLWEKTKILEQLGRLDDAIEALQRAQQNIKDPATISRKLGSLELRLGRFKEACVDLRQGLRRDPGNNSLRIRVARACEDAGEPGLAEQILQDGFVVPTSSPKLARALIDLKRRQGHNHFADLLVRRWADAYPDHEEFQEWANELPHAAP